MSSEKTSPAEEKIVDDYGKYVGRRLLLGPNSKPQLSLIGNAYVQPIEADILAVSATGKWVKIKRVATCTTQWYQVDYYEILDLLSLLPHNEICSNVRP